MAEGRSYWNEELPILMTRNGYPEEVYMTFSFGPIREDGGRVAGLFCACTEETQRVLGRRRLCTLRALADRATRAKSAERACELAAATLADDPHDVPFALLYLLDPGGRHAALAGLAGLDGGGPAAPAAIDLDGPGAAWPLREAAKAGTSIEVGELPAAFAPVPGSVLPLSPTRAVVLPLARSGQAAEEAAGAGGRPAGFLVAGVGPLRPLDDEYRGFLGLLAAQTATAVANARAYEEERKRAEALAELDRAKTAFFSSFSHEFRTPLTLMVGPVEDLLSDAGGLTPTNREHLELVRRNGLRLQKLVNNLLDFARIEAGRAEARYAPTDLAALTADLASTFRSACERAGLGLVVDCPPLPEPVFIDRDLWEKVVLNLLSNAFKFTPAGQIEVQLAARDRHVVLTVRDTGVGIPADELPRVFDRFHRGGAARGRTHEGSGIGLTLVRELTRLHGGDVRAESAPDAGSTFTVSVPLGAGHLPADRVGPPCPSTPPAADAFAEEALCWLSDPAGPPPEARDGAGGRPRILLADDNAAMRGYVGRLLAGAYDVAAVADGEAALASARARPPDRVLADVLMPRLDGLGLLRALRADPATRAVPVVLLSARAGEESRVEGLAAGVDDYLVKPFAARELRARVAAHLEVARARRDAQRRVTGILDSIADGFVALDRDWRYTYVNTAADAVHGVPRAELLGRRVWDAFPETVGTPFERMCRQAAESGAAIEFDTHYAPHDRWYAVRAFPSADGLSVHFRDVTDRKQVEEALSRSEAQLSEAQELAHIGSWSWDLATGTLTWSDEHYRIVGLRPQQFPMTPDRGVGYIHPDDRPWVEDTVRRAMADGQPYECRLRIRRDDGTVRVAHSRGRTVYDETSRPVRMFGIIQDITERVQAEADRERGRAEAARTELLRRLATSQEDERRQVARDLHDHVGQQLTALTLGLQAARDRGAGPDALADLQRTAEEVARGVHDVAVRLRPTALDDFGLAEALRSGVEEWGRAGGAPVALDTDGLEAERLPAEVETALYRVVQEAVHNALKHAGARRVNVLVERRRRDVTAIVEDDGAGFDADAVLSRPPAGRLGLVGMRERLSLVGGTLEVESARGAGTSVFARVPLPEGGAP